MYLHLGEDTLVFQKDILGIFDMDNATVSVHTRRYLSAAQKKGNVVNINYELPKSFVVCENEGEEKVYISQLSPTTLKKRSGKKHLYQNGILL